MHKHIVNNQADKIHQPTKYNAAFITRKYKLLVCEKIIITKKQVFNNECWKTTNFLLYKFKAQHCNSLCTMYIHTYNMYLYTMYLWICVVISHTTTASASPASIISVIIIFISYGPPQVEAIANIYVYMYIFV